MCHRKAEMSLLGKSIEGTINFYEKQRAYKTRERRNTIMKCSWWHYWRRKGHITKKQVDNFRSIDSSICYDNREFTIEEGFNIQSVVLYEKSGAFLEH